MTQRLAAPAVARAGLLDWLSVPSGRGIRVLDGPDWSLTTYDELAALVRGASVQLRERGVSIGSVVAIAERGAVEFVAAFFGTLYAGGTAMPLPLSSVDLARHGEHLAAILGVGDPQVVCADRGADPAFASILDRCGVTDRVIALDLRPSNEVGAAEPAEVALLQFTSGSTGAPRGVRVTWSNLESNIAMIRGWLASGEESAVSSWLPPHHDMGLIGLTLVPIVAGLDIWSMQPQDFIRDPRRWLEPLGGMGATITGAPTFGYAYAARRLGSEGLAGLDFSGWRAAIVGAERIAPGVLARFAQAFGGHGFDARAFRPAYGLAEATLAVTGHAGAGEARVVDVASARLPSGGVELDRTRSITQDSQDAAATVLTSCGRPLDGISVAIVDEEGTVVGERVIGEITVSGPSVADGYEGTAPNDSTRFDDGVVFTGDAGFLDDGELFVVGRMVDGFKVRGRRIFAEDVEARVAGAAGVPVGRCAVVSAPGAESDEIAVVVERPAGPWVAEAGRVARVEVGPSVHVRIYAAERGVIPRTTSGKPRRRALWQRVVGGRL
jgi:acyl-CoA synthetase (AMP-forming)/AMP-acid ligase II